MVIQVQIQIRQWKQVATQTSTTPQGELTLRKTHNSRPRSQRPRGKDAQCPCPQRINADKGHRSIRTITQKNYTSRFVRVIFAQGACKSSLHRSTGDSRIVRVILTPGPCNFHRITRVDAIGSRNFRDAQRPSSCFIDQKKTIPTPSNQACHPCTGVMPSASNSRCVITQAKKNTHQRLLKYVWSAIPVQIDSIRSHGERSGNPYQPGSPGANDRVQYRTHFRAVIRGFCSMCVMVISSGVCSKASYHTFKVVFILPASAGVHQANASLSVSRARGPVMTPILFPATKLLAEHAPERETTRFPYQTIEQNCVARVGKADGHEQKVRR